MPVRIPGVEGRGPARIAADGRHGEVARHHESGAGLDRRAERHQLERVEAGPRRADHRQREVRVGLGIAVTGEVLRGGEHPVVLQPADVGRDQPAHQEWILAERSGVDDRIGGIVVDVRDRRKGEVDPDRAALERGDPPHLVGVLFAPRRGHAHIGGEGRRAGEAEAGARSRGRPRSAAGARSGCCSRLSFIATSSGEPIETMIPPTPSESTQPCITVKALSSKAA